MKAYSAMFNVTQPGLGVPSHDRLFLQRLIPRVLSHSYGTNMVFYLVSRKAIGTTGGTKKGYHGYEG